MSITDRNASAYARGGKLSYQRSSPSVGLRLQPNADLQVYANYAMGYRMPSVIGTTVAYGVSRPSEPRPEQARNFDLGANIHRAGLLRDGDSANFKVGYFDSTIKDYISRAYDFQPLGTPTRGLYFHNLDKAKFTGFYLSADYRSGGFTGLLSATLYKDVSFCTSGGGCQSQANYADFATNQIPPKLQLSLDVSQTFQNDRLKLGARATYTGRRAAGVAGSPPENIWNLAMSMPIEWKPHTTLNLYGSYNLTETLEATFGVNNVTDKYYIDPLSTGRTPAPGRTAHVALDYRF